MRHHAQSPRPPVFRGNHQHHQKRNIETSIENQLRNSVYQLFNDYYPNLQLTKIKDKDGIHSVYYAKIKSQINIGFRYIVVTIPVDNFIPGYTQPLYGMKWNSFQTRILNQEYKMPIQSIKNPNKDVADYFSNLKFNQSSRQDIATYYKSKMLECDLLLLHSLKNPDGSVYPQSIDLRSALDSYMCVVSML